MKVFKLHFFKEKSRDLEYERILSFFKDIPEASLLPINENDSEVKIIYQIPIINLKGYFVISKKSTVEEIYKLDAKYLDINFRFEMPLFTPNFSAIKAFDVVEKLVKEFHYFYYNSLLENVMPYKREVVLRTFEIAKQNFKEKYDYELTNFYYYPESKLSECLKYVYEQYELHRFYKEQEVIVPNYKIVKDEFSQIYFAVEWKENTRILFPPNIRFIYYTTNNEVKIMPYDEVMAKLERYTISVPGFIENTKVIDVKNVKKVHKLVKKMKYTNIDLKLTSISLNSVTDIS